MALYEYLTTLQGAEPWGSVLDAGTGRASMRWLLSCKTERWTAVTGSAQMADLVRKEIGSAQRPQDQLLVGNWVDTGLLEGQVFDTVLADYLLGAIEGFAPFWQDRLFARLRPLTCRRLYIIGLEPYVPYDAESPAGRIIVAIGRLRDACLLLANDRPYREYPLDWVLRNLPQAGFRVRDAQRIAIRYGEKFINSQLDMCTRAIDRLADRALAVALHGHVAELRARALALYRMEGGLLHGHDYLIVAEPV